MLADQILIGKRLVKLKTAVKLFKIKQKKNKIIEYNIRKLWENFKWLKIHIIYYRMPQWRDKKKKGHKIMAQNFQIQ